jgi:hypothetical protein
VAKNKEKKFFDVGRYQNQGGTFVDGTDALANLRELVISFYHEPSGRAIFFKAFILAFSETYNSNFTPYETFGRTDPIYQYKSTSRKISLTFEIPASSEGEAFENLGRVSALQQMLYPSYRGDSNNALNLTQAPLIRLKVMNLLQVPDAAQQPPEEEGAAPADPSAQENFTRYKSTSDSRKGLLGIIGNLSVNHNMNGEDGVFHKGRNTILPKNIEISVDFSPIHEQTIGWSEDSQLNNLFPYGILTEAVELGDETNPLTPYNDKVEKEKAEAQQRKLRQQNIDNAKARYSGMLGGMRMSADIRRMGRGNEKAAQRMSDYTDAVFDEGLMEAGFANEEELDQFIADNIS